MSETNERYASNVWLFQDAVQRALGLAKLFPDALAPLDVVKRMEARRVGLLDILDGITRDDTSAFVEGVRLIVKTMPSRPKPPSRVAEFNALPPPQNFNDTKETLSQ